MASIFGSLLTNVIANPIKSLFGGLYNTLFGGLSKIPGAVLGLMKGLATNAFNTLAVGFKGLLVTLGAAAAGLVLAFKSAINSASEFGKAALSLRANTGASYGQAGKLLNRGLAFGMSSGETASNFAGRNPLTAGIFGNDYRSPSYYSNLSLQFNAGANSGPLGFMMAKGMLKAQGASDADLQIAAMNPNKVAAQEKWGNNISGQLGMKPGDIQRYAEDFTLAGNKVSTILELLKLKFAASFGPQLVKGIESVASLFARNSGRITSILEKVGGTLSTVFLKGLEVAIAWLDKNSGRISGFIQKAFNFLLLDFPPMLLRTGAFITGALASIVKAFSIGITELIKIAPTIASVFYDLTNAFITNLPSILEVTGLVIKGFSSLAKEGLGIVQMLTGKQTSATSAASSGDANRQGSSTGTMGIGPSNVGPTSPSPTSASNATQNNSASSSGPSTKSSWPGGLVTDVYNIWKSFTGAAGRGARHIGNMLGFDTGDPNKQTPGSEMFNNIVGGLITSALTKPLLGPIAGAAGNALSGLAAPVLGAAGNAIGGVWSSLMTSAMLNTGSAFGGALSVPGTMAAAAAGWPLLAGGAVGALGYEGLRKTGLLGQGMPSTIQMGMYGVNRLMGDSPEEAHKRIWNITDQKSGKPNVTGKKGGAPSIAGSQPDYQIPYPGNSSGNPVQDLITRLAVGTNNGLQLSLKNLQEHGPLLAKNADRAATWLDDQSMVLSNAADKSKDEMIALLQEANQRLASIDRNGKSQVDKLIDFMRDNRDCSNIVARAITYQAQDAALAARR